MKLEIRDGCFSYRKDRPILKGISIDVGRGEVLSVLGPNGVGKTTLMKCLLGCQRWDSGEVLIDGKNRNAMSSREFWRRAAYVPQARNQTFSYTVEETVLMGRGSYLGLFETPGEKDCAIAREAMERAGVAHLSDRSCSEISGGQLQLVLIARALAGNPELLIMDEPETGLDFRNQLIVLDLIQKLSHGQGLTILLNTHYPEHALAVSDKALLLNRDGSSCFGSADEIIDEAHLSRAFEVDVCIRRMETGRGCRMCVLPVGLKERNA